MNVPAWPRFTLAEWMFSAKSFAAGMLAVYLANRAGLPRPFWALLTAYVVANPLAGAVRSKALYRFVGTLVGSTAAVMLVPLLANAPELLTLALALWVGVCLYVSLLDRTPRAYIFMLSGYTAALIGFPSVQAPLAIFDTAVARVEEIGLAILCATLVHSIVLPAGLATPLLGLLDRTTGDARRWCLDLLAAGRPRVTRAATTLASDRRRLAADLTQLRLLSTHVPFDTSHLRWTGGALRGMQDRIAALTPTLSAVEDRLEALEAVRGALPADIVALLARIGDWLEAGSAAPPRQSDAAADGLRMAIQAVATAAVGLRTTPWERALRIGLSTALIDLVAGWTDCAALRREIDVGLSGARVASRRAALGNRVLHRDHGMALLSAVAAVLAICACGAFWIVTGWSAGSTAAMMAAVFCCFFAAQDDPVPAIHGFLTFTLWSVPVSALYVLVLLPLVNDFGMLVAICAPVFLVAGLYMSRVATMGQGLAFLFGIGGTLAIHDTSSVDLATFFNGTLAQVIGIVVAARVTRLVRSVGTDWSARRIQRAIWRELGAIATGPRAPGAGVAAAYAVRMLDRIGLLAARIAQGGAKAETAVADDALRDLRVGADIVALRRARAAMPIEGLDAVLAQVGAFFGRRGAGSTAALPPTLSADIDRCLAAALASADAATAGCAGVAALVGLRRNLFPHAVPAWQGAAP